MSGATGRSSGLRGESSRQAILTNVKTCVCELVTPLVIWTESPVPTDVSWSEVIATVCECMSSVLESPLTPAAGGVVMSMSSRVNV